MTDTEIMERLTEIVPTWQHVDTTKAGYNNQYLKTIIELFNFIQELKDERN